MKKNMLALCFIMWQLIGFIVWLAVTYEPAPLNLPRYVPAALAQNGSSVYFWYTEKLYEQNVGKSEAPKLIIDWVSPICDMVATTDYILALRQVDSCVFVDCLNHSTQTLSLSCSAMAFQRCQRMLYALDETHVYKIDPKQGVILQTMGLKSSVNRVVSITCHPQIPMLCILQEGKRDIDMIHLNHVSSPPIALLLPNEIDAIQIYSSFPYIFEITVLNQSQKVVTFFGDSKNASHLTRL